MPTFNKLKPSRRLRPRARLSDLLEVYPQLKAELRGLIAEVETKVIGSAVEAGQHVSVLSRPQQAAHGQGAHVTPVKQGRLRVKR